MPMLARILGRIGIAIFWVAALWAGVFVLIRTASDSLLKYAETPASVIVILVLGYLVRWILATK
jgi:hypothetical protein